MGFSEEATCAAIPPEISPGIPLRSYLKSKPNLTLASLVQVMRSHFREKDSTSTLAELSNACQTNIETCLEFVVRLMALRQKVLSLVNEEACLNDPDFIQARFLCAISTELRNNNIRGELRAVLKEIKISGEHLLKTVTEVVANENERNEKLVIKRGYPDNSCNFEGKFTIR